MALLGRRENTVVVPTTPPLADGSSIITFLTLFSFIFFHIGLLQVLRPNTAALAFEFMFNSISKHDILSSVRRKIEQDTFILETPSKCDVMSGPSKRK